MEAALEVNSSSPNPVLNPSPSPASSLPPMASSPPFIASAFNNNNHQKNKQNKAAQVQPPGAGHWRAWPAAAAYGRLPSPAACRRWDYGGESGVRIRGRQDEDQTDL